MVPKHNEQQQTRPQFEMRFDKILVEMGVIPKIIIPSRGRLKEINKPPLKLAGDYSKLRAKIPTDPRMEWVSNDFEAGIDMKEFSLSAKVLFNINNKN